MSASVCVEICHCSWKHLSPQLNFLSSYAPDDFYIAATELSFMLHNVQMQRYMKEVATVTLTCTPSGLLCLSVTISKFPAKPLLMLLLTAVQSGKCGLRLDINLHTGHDHGSG